jgi:SAM-dependent methyltransferase
MTLDQTAPSTPGQSGPPWLLDELANAGRENLDQAHVERYDDKEDGDASAEVALLVRHGLRSSSTLVDLGAGTGQLVLAAARTGASVTAVDISPVMVERLRAKASTAGLANLHVVQAGFLSYQHQGPLVDFVYTRWALHHLPDFWKASALTRIRSLLAIGGLLRLCDIVYSFDPHDIDARIEEWRATLPSTASPGDWVRADIDDHVRDEHSTFTWLLEPMIERAGFAIEHRAYSPDGLFADYLARAV